MAIKSTIIVSYSSHDQQFVKELIHFLHGERFDVLFDEAFSDAGERVVSMLDEMIRRADILLIVLSPAAVASKWVRYEISSFLARTQLAPDLSIIPLLLNPCEIPDELAIRTLIDFTDPTSHTEAKWKLADQLRRHNKPLRTALPISTPSQYQRNELLSLIERAVDSGMSRMKGDLGTLVHMFEKSQHLMSPDVISQKEAAVVHEVWVVTKDLHNDLYNKEFQESVTHNFGREIRYTYFVDKTELIDEACIRYARLYQKYASFWKFVTLPAGVFMPFDEVVIYDPRSVRNAWGYAQMKYVIKGQQDDDLFLKLPDRNVIDMASSLGLILERSKLQK